MEKNKDFHEMIKPSFLALWHQSHRILDINKNVLGNVTFDPENRHAYQVCGIYLL